MGANLYFATTGAVLEVVGVVIDDALLDAWRVRVTRALGALGWPPGPLVARAHASGASLALAAPCDRLYCATEVNEWALCAALLEREPQRWRTLPSLMLSAMLEEADDAAVVIPPVLEEQAALTRLATLAAREARPALVALVTHATARGLPHLLDESMLTLGSGQSSRSYALDGLPRIEDVPWSTLADIPTAVVTGSNGKTTCVRLVAACLDAHGLVSGYNCTDGVYVGGAEVDAGDYSGPAGTRLVLRDARTGAAVLETARGGILRRGIAASQADVALVTNVSSDHFGEYGIHDLAGLADVKLSVAGIVKPHGLLVLDADDALLCEKAAGLARRYATPPALAWFAGDADDARLVAHRAAGGATAGVRAGRLVAGLAGGLDDLGAVDALPLTVGGSARYNVANLAAAALVALALGVEATTIAAVYARFGTRPADNYGRMMRYRWRGADVLVDYAHNPAGLAGLLDVARHIAGADARLGLILGHAGNRRDADLEALARVAVSYAPDLVVVKENESQLRGRAPGEVPRLLSAALERAGLAPGAHALAGSELEAARHALAWARAGDVLALPVHGARARAEVVALLSGDARVS